MTATPAQLSPPKASEMRLALGLRNTPRETEPPSCLRFPSGSRGPGGEELKVRRGGEVQEAEEGVRGKDEKGV